MTWEVPFRCKENDSHCEGGQTLEQVAQRDHVISISDSIQHLPGHSLEQPDLSRGLDYVVPRCPFESILY